MVADIIKEIFKHIPKEDISDAVFEGANIVLYTKDKSFFKDDKGLIRQTVGKVKKRIELRPDPSLCMNQEPAEKVFKKLIPEEANVDNIIFDPQRSIVIIEAEKPGLVIGKQGELLREIKNETFWVPQVKRTPPIRSQIIENIRSVLYENSDYRRKFLHKVGERVYNGWMRQRKEEWVRITYLGSGRQVGRSAILLQTPESRVLLDCGIDPSRDDIHAYPLLEAPEFRIEELDAVVISHAHLDHTGFLPYLFKFGYKGPVYCTAPTRDTMSLLQLDVVKIAVAEGKEPLYTSDDIREQVKHTITLDYEEVTDITPDVRITFYNSGHMLGAAMVHLHIGNGLHNMLYSADIKYAKTTLLAPAVTKFPRLETLLCEGTYGSKDAVLPPVREQDIYVADLIKKTIEGGGKVLIPTLGSGRGQEMMVIVEKMIRQNQIPNVPVYVHGSVWDITAIYTAYPEFMASNIRSQIFHKDNNPFLADNIKRVGSNKEMQAIIDGGEPCIILATSGMLVGGPSVEYLKGLCENPKNTLLFSCYQAAGSLGQRIRDGEKEINFSMNSNQVDTRAIRMQVAKIEISGHADRRELMSFVSRCNPRPKRVLVNHGEQSRLLDFASSIHKSMKIETLVPRNLDSVRLR
ncbi:MAG: beta-CASP ribonuclease aCPSF1 [Nanoarchaeota archaeon]|nr:beta-CASP ribonuclease aCPSF1 [Nanoarchaeota archaeon]